MITFKELEGIYVVDSFETLTLDAFVVNKSLPTPVNSHKDCFRVRYASGQVFLTIKDPALEASLTNAFQNHFRMMSGFKLSNLLTKQFDERVWSSDNHEHKVELFNTACRDVEKAIDEFDPQSIVDTINTVIERQSKIFNNANHRKLIKLFSTLSFYDVGESFETIRSSRSNPPMSEDRKIAFYSKIKSVKEIISADKRLTDEAKKLLIDEMGNKNHTQYR